MEMDATDLILHNIDWLFMVTPARWQFSHSCEPASIIVPDPVCDTHVVQRPSFITENFSKCCCWQGDGNQTFLSIRKKFIDCSMARLKCRKRSILTHTSITSLITAVEWFCPQFTGSKIDLKSYLLFTVSLVNVYRQPILKWLCSNIIRLH